MSKRVVVVRDQYSPLWVVRCERPCLPDGWCQGRTFPKSDVARPPAAWLCWLASGGSREGVVRAAKHLGYEVVG